MLLVYCIVGIVAVGIASRPSRPVGAIVHFRNPYRPSRALIYGLELALPAAPVGIPVSVYAYEVAAPSLGINGVDELVQPVIVACHGWRAKPFSRSHHLRPCLQDLAHR